ncbi:MAG: hypothetical protein EXR79_03615 [Myxococcales bacterium]|nr:hypothetical protein [Myxococcales bacterium]
MRGWLAAGSIAWVLGCSAAPAGDGQGATGVLGDAAAPGLGDGTSADGKVAETAGATSTDLAASESGSRSDVTQSGADAGPNPDTAVPPDGSADGASAPDAAAGTGDGDVAPTPDSGLDNDVDGATAPADGATAPADVALPPPPSDLGTIYAHSSSTLYKLGVNGFQLIGGFKYDKNGGEMTDIALDDNGALFGVTFNDLFACNKATAACSWLAGLPQQFNGLTFVPKGTIKPNAGSLIAIANSGSWNLVDVVGGKATITPLGQYGGGMGSSGDAFSVEGVGTYATVTQAFSFTDKLVQVDPKTGAVLKTVGDTGVSGLWGVAWSAGTMYGFGSNGMVYAIDLKTGKASASNALQVPASVLWWGAGVSTRASQP